jgi:hypothetical protein
MTSAACSVYQRVSSASLGGGCSGSTAAKSDMVSAFIRTLGSQLAQSLPRLEGGTIPFILRYSIIWPQWSNACATARHRSLP